MSLHFLDEPDARRDIADQMTSLAQYVDTHAFPLREKHGAQVGDYILTVSVLALGEYLTHDLSQYELGLLHEHARHVALHLRQVVLGVPPPGQVPS